MIRSLLPWLLCALLALGLAVPPVVAGADHGRHGEAPCLADASVVPAGISGHDPQHAGPMSHDGFHASAACCALCAPCMAGFAAPVGGAAPTGAPMPHGASAWPLAPPERLERPPRV